ncbi:MAG: hypothetical protein LUG99_16135 [Lachnospiraceae bacterium]|nr:hypothetical protein [Lachnospiraceae bacterium]
MTGLPEGNWLPVWKVWLTKVIYYGKRFDTFESAMNQMLEYQHIKVIRHLDCISLRCFGFSVEGSARDWFSPYLETEAAVNHLTEETGVPFVCKKLRDRPDVFSMPGEGFVFGPLHQGVAVPELMDFYYNGDARYIFVTRSEAKKKYLVFDPRGMPGVEVSYEDLWELKDPDKTAFGIYVAKGLKDRFEPDYDTIYRKGIEFHKMIRDRERDRIRIAWETLPDDRGHYIALQCGLMNYMMQMDKVLAVAVAADKKDSLEEYLETGYIHYKQRIYALLRERKIPDMPRVLNDIWELFAYGY